jgi:phosphoribosyl 1,2-cyclic phosphodiesterase
MSTLLFEAGLPMQKLERFLAAEGVVKPQDLDAVLISHEHHDHCLSAPELAELGVPIWANREVLQTECLRDLPGTRALDLQSPNNFGDVEVACFPLSHDSVRPVGFLIKSQDRTIALATDLGEPNEELVRAVQGADLIVLEANHDRGMLLRGRYPYRLKERVAGPLGHLSNDQAAYILTSYLQQQTAEVWLAHLSRENNTAAKAKRTVLRELKAAGLGAVPLRVASRGRPSLRWDGTLRPAQLSLL